ncbi:MAG: AsmA-like C-terminal region-containing protein [Candidatus Omnitrophota bacterium]|jgi:hypothetical protein
MKKLLIVLIVLLILYLTSNYILNIFLPEKIDSLARSFVAEHSDKRIKISRIEVNIIKGIVLKDVLLLESNNKTPYLRINTIKLLPFYPSIFSDKKIFFSINIDGVAFSLKKNIDNTFNLPKLTFDNKNRQTIAEGEKINAKESAPGEEKKEFFFAKSISIKNLDIDFTDEKVNFRKKFSGFSLFADFVNLSKISFKLNLPRQLALRGVYDLSTKELSATASLTQIPLSDFTPYLGGIIVKDGSIRQGDITFSGKQNYSLKASAEIENIFAAKNDSQFKGNLNVQTDITFSGEKLDYRLTGDIAQGTLKFTPYIDSLNSINAEFSFNNGRLQFSGIEADFYKIGPDNNDAKAKIHINAKADIDFNKNEVYLEASSHQTISSIVDALKNAKIEKLTFLDKFTYKESGNIELKGSLKTNSKDKTFEYYVDYKINGAKFEDFKNITAKGFVKKDKLSIEECSLNYKNIPLNLKANIESFSNPSLSLRLTNDIINVTLNTRTNKNETNIDILDIKTKKSHIASKGTLGTQKEKLLKLEGAATLDCKEALTILNKYNIKTAFLSKLKPEGPLSAKFLISGPLKPKDWQIKLAGLSEKMKIYGAQITNFRIELYRDKDILIISPAAFEAADGKFDLRTKIDSKNEKIVVNLIADEVDLAILAKQIDLKSKNLSGILSINADCENKGLSKWDKLKGTGQISIKEGNIWEINFLKGLGQYLFIPEFEQIKFDEGSSDLIFKGENIVFENTELRGLQMTLKGKGRLSTQGALNFLLVCEFNPNLVSASQSLQKIFTSVLGQTAISIELGGTVKKPTYKVQPIIFSDLKSFKKIFEDIFKEPKK